MTDQNLYTGNLGNDPELRWTSNGKAVCSFSIGNTPRRMNPQTREWEDGETVWWRVECWDTLAENVAASFKKGYQVAVLGSVVNEKYVGKDGAQRSSLKVRAENVFLSVRSQRITGVTKANSNRSGRVPDSVAPAPAATFDDGDAPF